MKTSNLLKFLYCTIMICIHTGLNAQIGINTDTIDASAVLQISAGSRGLLIPSLSDTGLIVKPADGLVFYNDSMKAYYIHTRCSWKIMVPFEIPNDTSISTSYNIVVKGGVLFQNNVTANSDVTTNGNVTTNRNLTTNGSVTANGDIIANRNVTISGNISAQNYVNNATGNGPVPKGGIIMWSGNVGQIPIGWALCDGTKGTPDLRDRFVVSIGHKYNIGDIGGADSIALDTTQMPKHKHIAYGTISGGAHSHTFKVWNDQINTGPYPEGSDVASNAYNASTNTDGAHTHNANTIQISYSGQGKPFENRPPYYALAYIMKL